MITPQFSDEANTCIDCLALNSPGKFDAEALATYHAYHTMLSGRTDDEDGIYWRIGNVICERNEDSVDGLVFGTEAEAIAAWDQK